MNRPPDSPKPTGRPRSPDSQIAQIIAGVKERMADGLSEVVEELLRIALNPNVGARERISACDKIIKHSMGNPSSHVELTGKVSHVFTAWEPSREKLAEYVDGEVVNDD